MTDVCVRMCKNCDAWEDIKLGGHNIGECRASIPSVSAVPIRLESILLNAGIWPWTASDKWCWAFKPRFHNRDDSNI
jgi:hypothetical protein